MVVMSKVKDKKKHASERQSQPARKHTTVKKKKKNKLWIPMEKAKVEKKSSTIQLTNPPKDEQLFSANWKLLQETLKSTQTKTNKPQTSELCNGSQQEKKGNLHRKNKSSKTDSGKVVQHKTFAAQAKSPAALETKQPSASKRKNTYKPNDEQTLKKPKLEAKVTKPAEVDIWFDDVDPEDLEATVGPEAADIMRKKMGVKKNPDTEAALVKTKAFEGLTKAVGIDCEMVGVGPDGEESILARVSLVNHFGKCVYDKYVKPTEKVTDYRTAVSGIRPEDIIDGEDVRTVQKEVAEIIKGRILVGHALHNDLKILHLDHPKKKIRDTQKYKPFRKIVMKNRPALRVLCEKILNVKVQQGEHSSVQDAQATMRLYTMVRKHWEAEIKKSRSANNTEKKEERKPRLSKNSIKS
uniref:RNA exonuclease 4 n=1 Tax=Doryrhamphus excisus TaxID=161450 RepID=UPI0025AE9C0D|nr:RNA exonuclease 4 [Doryrhamphus excisus]XP_057918169.1 RNA exonuclease 4 [Doryrhamphus excisus]XP_057918170.1 RNA exonuclease 4 [Doryrhamphus excisus]